MTTTTAWAAKSPIYFLQDGKIDLQTINPIAERAMETLVKLEMRGEPGDYEAMKRDLLSAGWRIVKVKIEEVE